MDALKGCSRQAGPTFDTVVKLNCYFVDIKQAPEWLLEVEAIAVVPEYSLCIEAAKGRESIPNAKIRGAKWGANTPE